ncbi:adenylosuccinate lyase [Arenibacter sp. 6A1]|uniref:adenylosuccinate lyase n=1 Tax=Arenibacter sp. 6A1 TaxID=2720391 RepID=UPI001447FE77|nr:adenylosuccinate lyase [Arenibacter sp. 6A1]NKI27272.1 adenylosuccinate lyase [Arenibacter sp. 6A1]
MTPSELYHLLHQVSHSIWDRRNLAAVVQEDPQLISSLLKIAFQDDAPISCKACWVLEFVAKERLDSMLPHLNVFTTNIGLVRQEASIRPLAKICEYLTKSYFIDKSTATQNAITEEDLEQITKTCFDWLIGEHKVAAKAYSMTGLLLLGQKFKWIHPELKLVLEQNYHRGSAAYKARARQTLAKIS